MQGKAILKHHLDAGKTAPILGVALATRAYSLEAPRKLVEKAVCRTLGPGTCVGPTTLLDEPIQGIVRLRHPLWKDAILELEDKMAIARVALANYRLRQMLRDIGEGAT